jgi:hypothetical protein
MLDTPVFQDTATALNIGVLFVYHPVLYND